MKASAIGLAASLMLAAAPPTLAQTSPTAPTTPPPAASPSGQPMWYSHQADEMRASKLIGTKVVNTANETIGDINEIVLGKDGKVAAVIIGVGGFLGMGEREVAMNFEVAAHEPRFQQQPDPYSQHNQRCAEGRAGVALGYHQEVIAMIGPAQPAPSLFSYKEETNGSVNRSSQPPAHIERRC